MKDIWIREKSENFDSTYLFKMIKMNRNKTEHEGDIIKTLDGINMGDGLCYPRIEFSRKLEPWEIVKYRMLGYL